MRVKGEGRMCSEGLFLGRVCVKAGGEEDSMKWKEETTESREKLLSPEGKKMKAEIASKTEEGEETQLWGGKEKKRPQREEDQVNICCHVFIVKTSPGSVQLFLYCWLDKSENRDLTKSQRCWCASRESLVQGNFDQNQQSWRLLPSSVWPSGPVRPFWVSVALVTKNRS